MQTAVLRSPLSICVMEDAESGKGYIGCYDGGAFGLPVTSENKDAALLFLAYIGQDSVQPDWAVAAPRITNAATYDDPEVIAMDKKLTATTRWSRMTGICLQVLRLSVPRSGA